MKGRFLTFEGPEGSGKTTQAARLADRLRTRGLDVVAVREPGGTRTGEAIREILQGASGDEDICPETEVLLFAASRAQLVKRVVAPALERGAWVVCDRFADSTTAYQGFGRGFDVERMLELNAFAVDGTWPDATFLLDLDVAAGFDRLGKRNAGRGAGWDRIERENRSFHERVRCGYLELARRWPERFAVVAAGEREDEVAERIWNEAVQRCGWPLSDIRLAHGPSGRAAGSGAVQDRDRRETAT